MSDYDFTNVVRTLSENENIQNCKLEHKYSSNKGDGYLGTVQAVELIGTNKQLDVVFKFSHRDPKAHKTVPLREAYLTEINFYENIAPAFAKFQAKHQIKDPFNNSPKFYACVTEPLNELLVLENLKTQNYDLWNRKLLMNKEHLECALKTFAKFHGTSFAMQCLDKDLYNKVSQGLDEYDLFVDFITRMDFANQLKSTIRNLLHIFDPITETHYREKLERFSDRVGETIEACLKYRNHDVILQGDCWCNNAMYQYEDMTNRIEPKHMKMLDFQAVRLGPPTFDLTYFFYSIAPRECLDDLEYYQKYYYDSLVDHANKFQVNLENIYDYEKFLSDWKELASFGLILSFTVTKLMFTEGEDAPDITKDLDQFISNFKISGDKEQVYHQQMKDIVRHNVDRKFI